MKTTAMQTITEYATDEQAAAALPGILAQEDCIGARLMRTGGVRFDKAQGCLVSVERKRHVQAFFPALPAGAAYPDGCREVMIPEVLLDVRGGWLTQPMR